MSDTVIELLLAEASPPATARPRVADSEPLDDVSLADVLGKLPPPREAATSEFVLRKATDPPPRTGADVRDEVGAVLTDHPGPTGDDVGVRVVRITPTGDVEAAAKLTITFDRPVAPVGWEGVPQVQLEPPIAGRWRALGTSTLVFEPQFRLPGATTTRIALVAGATMPNGVAVAEAHEAQVSTAPLTLVRSYPDRELAPRGSAIVVLQFDQRIDADALAAHIRGDAGFERINADLESLHALDPAAAEFVADAPPQTFLALRTEALKPGRVVVRIPPGAPSAEGPRRTTEEQNFVLSVAGAFTAAGPATNVPPHQGWSLNLSNKVDPASLEPDDFEIVPAPRDPVNVYGYGHNLTVDFAKRANTQYLLRVPDSVCDIHGQRLGGNREFVVQTTDAQPAMFAGYRDLGTVLRDAPRQISVFATNLQRLDVAVYEVTPDDWFDYKTWCVNARHAKTSPPGTLLGERAIDVAEVSRDESTRIDVDVSWGLPVGEVGHRIVVIRPTPEHNGQWPLQPHRVWLQSTTLGVSAWRFKDNLRVWVSALADGSPRTDCAIRAQSEGHVLRAEPTDADGIVDILSQPTETLVVAELDTESSILPVRGNFMGYTSRDVVAHIFDDRGMYRPGETVTLSGWVRRTTGPNNNDLEVYRGPARLIVKDMHNTEIVNDVVSFDEQGRFQTTTALPREVMLGHARVEIAIPRLGTLYHQFQIQEFRRPEFEVRAELLTGGPHLIGEDVGLAATGTYYSGEGLSDAAVQWDVTAKTTTYAPPGWPGFVFGRRHFPWFGWRTRDELTTTRAVSGRTDANGTHGLSALVPRVDPPQPVLVTGSARITDVNRQTWSGSTSSIVHPSAICIGARTSRAFVGEGEDVVVDLVATDLDGEAVPGRQLVTVLERGESRMSRGLWRTDWIEVARAAVASAAEPVRVQLSTAAGGSHRVVVTSADDEDRVTRTELDLWVSGARRQTVGEESLTLIPRDAVIQAPTTAEFAVATGFASGRGRWFLLHHEVVASGDFSLVDGQATLSVPVSLDLLPQVRLLVTAVGTDDEGVPTLASASVDVPVWDHGRRLGVEVQPTPAETEPGSRVALEIAVEKPDGTPASGAFATVWVVDEAVLALSNYATPDPVKSLYPASPLHAQAYHSRETILRPAAAEEGSLELHALSAGAPPPQGAPRLRAAMAPGGFGGGGAEAPTPIAVRTNFDALAAFVGAVEVDSSGRATVDIDLPDNLTRYRVMVNAQLGGGQFGCGDAALTARLGLMVRPTPPRFANFGDRFELGVVVQNATAARCDVDVAVRADNLELRHGDHDGRRVTLGAGQRAEVRFDARPIAPGEVAFDVVADTVSTADAAAGTFPVYSPATTEAVATYGTIDDGASEHLVQAPDGAVRPFGGLEVTTSSTALQALTDAVLYLARYPYDCAEQRASRVLAIAALRDVLEAFEAEQLPSPTALLESMNTDIAQIAQKQNSDGGWGFWRESWPVVSIHVVHALVQARDAGIDVRPDVLARGLGYLDQIERYLSDERYDLRARLTLRAYAAFVRTRAGLPDHERALAVIRDAEALDAPPLAAAAWCLAVLHHTPAADVLLNYALNRVSETESTAVFAADIERSGEHLVLGSERRTDAVMLWALMDVQPQSELIPKLVYGLLAHRKRGRWGSTQENAHVLLALQRYFQRYEATTPDFVARAWLGDQYAGGHEFRGRTTERHHVQIPMSHLADAGEVPLVLQKDGAGRMYYRVGLHYALAGTAIEPLDRGFVVDRRYEAVDDEGDVGRRDDGTWVVRAGARVRVVVSMLAPMRRHHVALVDPLPAGFEPLNPALAVTERTPDTPSKTVASVSVTGWEHGLVFWWHRRQWTWFEHQNLRDERAEAFTSMLRAGHHEYVYHARATTVGDFVVAPSKAEEMYSPEVFGRGASDRVVIAEF